MKKIMSLLVLLLVLMIAVTACSNSGNSKNGNPGQGNGIRSEEENSFVYLWPEGPKYYYAFEEKIYLDEVPNTVVVSFDEQYLSEIEKYLQKNDQIRHTELQPFNKILILTTAEDSGTGTIMKDLKKQAGVKFVHPMYAVINGGGKLIFTDQIVVQYKKNVLQQKIDEMHKRFNISVVKTTELHQLLSVPVNLDPLEVANVFQESGLVNFSYPNFIAEMNSFP